MGTGNCWCCTFVVLGCMMVSVVAQVPSSGEKNGSRNNLFSINQELIISAAAGDITSVEKLLEDGAEVNSRINGTTALIEASFHGHADVVSTLIKSGAISSAQDDLGFSALHAAAQEAHLGVINILLEAGADVEHRTIGGSTALVLAVVHGHANVTAVLLKSGANQDVRDGNGVPVLYIAAQNGFIEVLKLLLQSGASVDAALLELQSTPLMAAAGQHLDIVKELIRKGADVNLQDIYGVTALHLAVISSESEPVARQLIASKANIDAQDDNGDNPLHWAARFGNLMGVELLLDVGSDPSVKDSASRTPAEIICECKLHKSEEDVMQCPENTCSEEDEIKIKETLEQKLQYGASAAASEESDQADGDATVPSTAKAKVPGPPPAPESSVATVAWPVEEAQPVASDLSSLLD